MLNEPELDKTFIDLDKEIKEFDEMDMDFDI